MLLLISNYNTSTVERTHLRVLDRKQDEAVRARLLQQRLQLFQLFAIDSILSGYSRRFALSIA